MDSDRIQELAVLHATHGLQGADLLEFELWWSAADAEERAAFTETVDTITMITLSNLPPEKPPAHLKNQIMKRLDQRQDRETPQATPSSKTKDIPAGYSFMMDVDGPWRELPTKGTRIKELSASRETGTATFILEMDPGSRLLSHHHRGAEEAFVLYGDLQMRGKTLHAGDYMRAEPGTKHEDLYSEGGCRALIITALENYPQKSIRTYDRLHRVWKKCKQLVTSSS